MYGSRKPAEGRWQCPIDAVIIPGCETLRSTTIERLKTFARAGGKLILMGEAPTMTDAVPSNDGAELAALSSQIVFEKAALLEAVEPYRTLRLENETGGLTNHYIYQLRMDQDCSWLFIAVGEPAGNPDFVKKDPVNIVLNGRFTVKEYDTMTGRIRDVKTAKRGAQTVVNHIFYNQSSLLLKLMRWARRAAACRRLMRTMQHKQLACLARCRRYLAHPARQKAAQHVSILL